MLRSLPSHPLASAPELFPDEWEQIIREFERAWLASQFPDIAKSLPEDATARAAILPQLVLADLEFRLKRREPARVETYLERFPELLKNATAIQEFLTAEFHLRRRFEPLLSPAEYQLRFPQFAAAISDLSANGPDGYGTKVFRLKTVATGEGDVLGALDGDSITLFRSQDDPIVDAGNLADWTDLEIREELGHGGMGTVYLAWQRSLERLVAVKVLRPFADLPPDAHARFRREAIVAAQLHHPNIVQVFSFGEVGRIPFYVMEYVSGGPLSRQLAGKPQAQRDSARLIETLARALHFAHEQKLLHRDLKPSNILLLPDGTPKLGDFGLVLRLDSADARTSVGTVVGTPSYMAPEQASGTQDKLTPAVDVYSLGAVLYELLTGRPPFPGETNLQTLEQLRTCEPVPPRRMVPELAADLETICLTCLHKEPTERYASALELADDLRRFLDGRPILARQHRIWHRWKSWCRRQPALTATTIALLIAVVSLALLFPSIWWSAAQTQQRLSQVRSVFRQSHSAIQARLVKTAEPLELRRARRHYESFLSEHANDPEVLPERTMAHFGLGTVLQLLNETTAGIEHWFEAQRLFDQSAMSLGVRDPWSLYWFTEMHNKLAAWHRSEERLEEAWSTLDRMRVPLEKLTQEHPSDPAIEYCLAWCYSRYGTLGQKKYRADEAIVYGEQAWRIWQDFLRAESAMPFDSSLHATWPRARLGPTLKYLGLSLQTLERHEESLLRFQELLTLAESALAAPSPTIDAEPSVSTSWQELRGDAHHGLARGHYMIGKQLLNDSKPDLAEHRFLECIEHWTVVTNSGSASSSQRSYLASSHFHLAIAHRRQGHRREALEEYQTALQQWVPMLSDQMLGGFNRELAESHANECRLEIKKIQDQLANDH